MAGLESLNTGQKVALKPTEDNRIPPVHGEIGSTERGRIHIRLAQGSRKNLSHYHDNLRCIVVWDDRGRGLQAPVITLSVDAEGLVVTPDVSQERREMARIQTSASFTYEIVDPEHAEEVGKEILAAADPYEEPGIQAEKLWHSGDELWEKVDEEFTRMNRQMMELNAKIDYLVAAAEGRMDEHSLRRHRQIEDFSGSGLCFFESESVEIGTILSLDIELSRFPRKSVRAMGEVVRNEGQAKPGEAKVHEYNIGVCFTTINEDDREAIIRHIFRIQRRQLRNRAEKGR